MAQPVAELRPVFLALHTSSQCGVVSMGHGRGKSFAMKGAVLLSRDAIACSQLFKLRPTHCVEHFCNVGVVLPHNALGSTLSSFALNITLAQLHRAAATGGGGMGVKAPHSTNQRLMISIQDYSTVPCEANKQPASPQASL
jgi:hypothetical protein